jgi:predicted metal-dependent HD superfamily phosphohydrolase
MAVANAMRFSLLLHRLGGCGEPGPLFSALSAAYAESHRAYHTFAHIADCLNQFDAVSSNACRPDEVEMALWFHDAVYDPRVADNEEKSAAWVVTALFAGGMAAASVARVSSLILATKHESLAAGTDAQIVADIDLSILGREPIEFDNYDRAIRSEYQWVPERQYREARARILRGFVNRRSIYQTDYFQTRYEHQARVNLERAIARLTDETV